MSTRLPCCFMVFYDYLSWQTGGSPFEPQVPGYLKPHIIHSFLTILNYKPCVHVVLPSWIYRLFLISLRRLNFTPRLWSENPVKRSFQSPDRSKAVVPLLFLLCVARSLHYGALHVWSCPTLCLCVSSVLLAF